MKVVEFAKKHEITVNQAKKAVKVVLGVDVSKDRTLTPDELAKLEAVLRDPQLSTSQQHKALPEENAQFIQNGVQSSEAVIAEPGTEQLFQADIQPMQNGVQSSEAVIAEPGTEQLFQADVQPIQNGVQLSEPIKPEPGTEQSVQPMMSKLDNNVQTGQNGVQLPNSQTPESIAEQSFQADVQTESNLDKLDGKLDSDSKLDESYTLEKSGDPSITELAPELTRGEVSSALLGAGQGSPDFSKRLTPDADFVQDCPTENALTVGDPQDAIGRVQRLGTAEKDLREGTVQLKTEISKAQGRGAGVATGLAFMQGLLEGEQEVLDMFTNQSLEVFDQLQTTIDQQVASISEGTGDLLGKISTQRALNQERLRAIRSRVASMIHRA
jgi:hypothetical protein